MSACKKCLLPEAVPGSEIDEQGLCRPCRELATTDRAAAERVRKEREEDLARALGEARGQGEFDALVCLSGGKDSIALLHRLKHELGLRVLAFTVDMNVPPVAWQNIERTIAKLDVPHVVYKPSSAFYTKLYRFLLKNQESRGAVRSVCYVCAPLFEGYALKLAVEKKIPLVLAGYSPGQPDPRRMVYEFPRRAISEVDWTPAEVRESGLFSEEELALFWNPAHYPEGTRFPRYLAPFHAWPYDQSENMRRVVELGLVAKARHANPIHSNCPLNWLLMYSDLKNLGYNPYVPEFASLIREGKASRSYWKLMLPVVNFMIRAKVGLGKNVRIHMDRLGLTAEDLVIRREPRPEWPAHVLEPASLESGKN